MKEFLSRRSIPFVEKDVSRDQAAAAEMVRLSGQRGVPVTVVDGRVVVGFDEPTLTQLLARASRARLGAAVADAAEMAAQGRCQATQGAYIGRITAGGPAARADLAVGDVIVSLGGHSVNSAAELEALVKRLQPGHALQIRYVRGGAERETTLTL